MNVKTIDFLQEGVILPCKPDVCRYCAVDHAPQALHDRDSLYYQYRFKKLHGRWPVWADAVAHCSDGYKSDAKKILIDLKSWTGTKDPIAEMDDNNE